MGVWYRSGTVAVTSGSKTVTGTGTQWQNLIFGVAPGVTFYGPDGKPYEIDTVNSNTSLTLVTNYSGATASGQAYAIDPTRSGSVASLAAQTSEVLKFSQGQFTQIQNWFTGAASANVTLTSPAGQTITVPSYSKVTSEGEGQAARAKTEADKAAASAALAGDIVAASALPLPDVWAPLSDSLRLITGYGREVKVGEDVVARMVNFVRSTSATYIGKDGQLKTAAVNEPRFEKEGLLVEGQSTNLLTRSQQFTWGDGTGATSAVQSPNTDPQTSSLIPTIDVTAGRRRPFISNILTAGKTYTVSFRAKSDGGAISQVANLLTGAVYPAVVPGEWKTYSFTGVATNTVMDFQITGASVSIAWIQVEELPFASSYIPTNGAAVTRAADEWNIPNKINCGPSPALPMSVAVNFTCMGYVSFNNIFVAGDRQLMVYSTTNKLRLEQGGYSTIDLTSNSVGLRGAQNKLRAVCSDSRIACLLNGIMTELSGGVPIVGNGFDYFGSSRLRNQFGHIRDLRIWRIALTNEQLKAIA